MQEARVRDDAKYLLESPITSSALCDREWEALPSWTPTALLFSLLSQPRSLLCSAIRSRSRSHTSSRLSRTRTCTRTFSLPSTGGALTTLDHLSLYSQSPSLSLILLSHTNLQQTKVLRSSQASQTAADLSKEAVAQEFHDQQESGEEDALEQANSSLDPVEDRQHH
ncbi:hypothetical protein G4B88_007533 [Cannabis sativa]|uniref:Uncharacterized protein n=1 Tax=Cannabis sativa TaxID=3483 RepID=A0A7J6HBH2_CANSA|nr:hypothetical protein G4B88_007533 [Cannabis sativa]